MEQLDQIWQQVTPILNDIFEMVRAGFYEVNDIRGIVIAAIGAYLMHDYRRVPFIVLGCVVAHVTVQVLGPVVVNKAAFRLPPLVEPGYWLGLVALALGYFIIVSVFYLVKRMFQRLTGGGH